MAKLLKKIDMYSQVEKKVVPFDVELKDNVQDKPEAGQVVVVSHGSENYRFSPSITNEELKLHADHNVRVFAALVEGEKDESDE